MLQIALAAIVTLLEDCYEKTGPKSRRARVLYQLRRRHYTDRQRIMELVIALQEHWTGPLVSTAYVYIAMLAVLIASNFVAAHFHIGSTLWGVPLAPVVCWLAGFLGIVPAVLVSRRLSPESGRLAPVPFGTLLTLTATMLLFGSPSGRTVLFLIGAINVGLLVGAYFTDVVSDAVVKFRRNSESY